MGANKRLCKVPSLIYGRLIEVLDYDEGTGNFTQKAKLKNSANVGELAGTYPKNGYATIQIDGERHSLHRLAWFYVHKQWPKHHIDHIDGNPANNAIANLRDVSSSGNMQNRKTSCKNTSGHTGVVENKQNGRWYAKISLGSFESREDAIRAYQMAKITIHGLPKHAVAVSKSPDMESIHDAQEIREMFEKDEEE